MSRRHWEAIGAIAAVAGVVVAIVAIVQDSQKQINGAASNSTQGRIDNPDGSTSVPSVNLTTPGANAAPPQPSPELPAGQAAPPTHGGPLQVAVRLESGAVGINKVSHSGSSSISLEVSDRAGRFNRGDESCFMHIETYLNGNFKNDYDYECGSFTGIWYPRGMWRFDYTVNTIFNQSAKTSLTLESV